MDVTYIRALNEKDKEEKEDKPAAPEPELSTRNMSPALFDALFGSNDNRRRQ